MGAYGQIESVWTVHGSVLIRSNKAGKPELWCVAGRSMVLDGGLRLLRLNTANGKRIDEKVLDYRVPGNEDNLKVALSGLNMPVSMLDVLGGQGHFVHMSVEQLYLDVKRLANQAPK